MSGALKAFTAANDNCEPSIYAAKRSALFVAGVVSLIGLYVVITAFGGWEDADVLGLHTINENKYGDESLAGSSLALAIVGIVMTVGSWGVGQLYIDKAEKSADQAIDTALNETRVAEALPAQGNPGGLSVRETYLISSAKYIERNVTGTASEEARLLPEKFKSAAAKV